MLEEIVLPVAPDPGRETFGPYNILCQIGEGGLGSVYLAEQTDPVHREVALKIIKQNEGGRESAARFEAERRVLALMEHPNIARMIDAGTSSFGRPYLAMEFVDGLPINEYCDSRALTIRQRLELFAEVCDAVEYAHRRKVLHRDLKPSNILVAERDGKAVPKIIDFGIAKAFGGGLYGQALQTQAGQMLGTLEYMSPEQAGATTGAPDTTTDVYSLGVVLYELLCGALPFNPEWMRTTNLSEVLRVVHEEQPPDPGERLRGLGAEAHKKASERGASLTALTRDLSGDITFIVQTAMAKDPSERYQTSGALRDDINRYLRNEPLVARKRGALYRLSKVAQRRRRAIVAGATVLSLGAAVVSAMRARRIEPTELKVSPVTSYRGHEFDVALSRDGQRAAFSWNRESNNYDIHIKHVLEGEPVRLTTDPAHDLHPSWSPDGHSIAFLRVSPHAKEVMIVPATGGPERKLLKVHARSGDWEAEASIMDRAAGPSWSPNGRVLAVGDRDDNSGPDCIYLVTIETGARRKLTSPDSSSLGDSLPAFSPRGDTIAFVRTAGERQNTDIYVAEVTSGRSRRVTFDQKQISGLDWISEDTIVFTSNRGGSNMLWSLAVPKGKPELIAIAGRNVTRVSATPGLGRVALTESYVNTNIWRSDLTRPGVPPERLISTTRRNDSPKYSPDGQRIVFGSNRSGTYEIWVADSEGRNARQVTSFAGMPVGTPRWSPDGRQIVFDARKDGRSAIYIVNADGGPARKFTNHKWDDMMPSWSSDGRHIYFVSSGAHNVQRVWKQPVDGGPAVQITHHASGEAIENPEGTRVYFSNGRNGIWQVMPDGGDERVVPGLEHVRNSRYFAVTRRGCYFLRDVNRPHVIEFYDFRTRTISRVAEIERQILYGTPNLSVSADERWMLFSQEDDSGSDIIMIAGFK